MRLAFPRIKNLQTDDGAASIKFLKVNTSRDVGGFEYLFRFRAPSGNVDVHAILAIVTDMAAARQFGEGGASLWSLHPTQVRTYVERYAAEHGHTFEVRLFEVPAKTSDATILILRDAFCKLVLECWSSFRFNNADDTGDPSDSYPDTLHFVPDDLDTRFHFTLMAAPSGPSH